MRNALSARTLGRQALGERTLGVRALDARPAALVSVAELKTAWTAVQAGRFGTGVRTSSLAREAAATDLDFPPALTSTGRRWEPGVGEQVLPVLGCVGSCGASTLAVALATAVALAARVVECSSLTASGMAAASTAELGRHESGWTRGTRDGVLLERASQVLGNVNDIPTPSRFDPRVALTVLDVGWEIGQVLRAPTWLGEHIRRAPLLVLVTTATVPGLRRLEGALDLLTATNLCVAVVGPQQKKWPRPVGHSAGPRTRALAAAGRLVEVPRDRALAVAGLDTTPLPTPVLAAATRLLQLLPPGAGTTKGNPT